MTQSCSYRIVTHFTDVNVVSWVPVERLLETLLIQVVTDETDRATQDEETVKGTDLSKRGRISS